MAEGQSAQAAPRAPRENASGVTGSGGTGRSPAYAALDLGTNNCRLLVAQRSPGGFRVIDSFSRIVRLGEGVASTGRLSEAAMARTLDAVSACAEKLKRREIAQARFVATQACRAASNGPAFLAEVKARTGIGFDTITPREEARLSVLGCADLMDARVEAAVVVDIGGGSTEISWARPPARGAVPRIEAWTSLPIGVVTLAERFPETAGAGWYEAMRDEARSLLAGFEARDALSAIFRRGEGHIVGTSGAITSLAGVHMGLPRYQRRLVDGIWIGEAQTRAAIARLRAQSPAERAQEPCIGPDRADLVLAGAAILEAVMDAWPAARLRVADRGLREGLILTMLARARGRRRRRR